jgi:hypothetical protein
VPSNAPGLRQGAGVPMYEGARVLSRTLGMASTEAEGTTLTVELVHALVATAQIGSRPLSRAQGHRDRVVTLSNSLGPLPDDLNEVGDVGRRIQCSGPDG